MAEEDEKSTFFGRSYSEFEFSQTVYNYYIHPQWDDFGSKNLYTKILFVDYEIGLAIFEFIGEWNDAIEDDIMTLRRELTDAMMELGIKKFILIAENVLNFHSGDRDYYEDWIERLNDEEGWVVILNLPEQSQHDFLRARLHHYVPLLDIGNWRTQKPEFLLQVIEQQFRQSLH